MTRADEAVETFMAGFNCAQGVFSTFATECGLDRDAALKIATGFGAGMSYQAEICGAVTGAVMALGMKYGRCREDDVSGRDRTVAAAQEFLKRFRDRHRTVICQELLGTDISDPARLARARDENLFRTKCPDFVRDAAEILEEMLGGR